MEEIIQNFISNTKTHLGSCGTFNSYKINVTNSFYKIVFYLIGAIYCFKREQ